jgi:hypothetical protein
MMCLFDVILACIDGSTSTMVYMNTMTGAIYNMANTTKITNVTTGSSRTTSSTTSG